MNHRKVKLHLRGCEALAKGDTATVRGLLPEGTTWHLPDRRCLCGEYRGREELLGFASKAMMLSGGAFGLARAGDRRSLAVRGVFGRAVQSIAVAATVLWTSAARRRWMMGSALSAVALFAASGPAWASSTVYVTGEGKNLVAAYSVDAGGTLMHASSSQFTGALPHAVAVSPNGNDVYVANYGDGTVSQYTGGSLASEHEVINAGSFPDAVAVSPNGSSVYVTNSGGGTVSQYDVGAYGLLSPKTPASISAGGGPLAVAVSPDGNSVYVVNASDGTVSQYDVGASGVLSPKTPPTVSAGSGPGGVAITPDGRSVYVVNRGGTVSQYDVGAGGALSPKTPAMVAAGPYPTAIAVSPDGRSVYVADEGSGGLGSSGTVSQYDVGAGGALSPKTPATISTGSAPFGVAVSPNGRSVYVTNNYDNTVSQYDVGGGGELSPKKPATADTPAGPFGVVVLPDQGPVAAFGVSGAPAGSPTSFDGSASADFDGTVSRYSWNFGDGTTAADAGPTPTHTYGTAGRYTVTLTVTDDAGCSTALVFTGQTASCNGTAAASVTQTVTVPAAGAPAPAPLPSLQPTPPPQPTPPHAVITMTPSAPGPLCPGQKVHFDATDSTPGSSPITKYFWTFRGSYLPGYDGHDWLSNGQFVDTFSETIVTRAPDVVRAYNYYDVYSRQENIPAFPDAAAILGDTVDLEVEDADGLSSRARAPYFAFYDQFVPLDYSLTPPDPHCQTTPLGLTSPAQLGHSLSLTGNSIVEVPVTCAQAPLCGGVMRLSTALNSAISARVATIAARERVRAVVVGETHFALTRGHHAMIKVALNKRGRALARQGRLHRLRVTMTSLQLGAGMGKAVSGVLTVKR